MVGMAGPMRCANPVDVTLPAHARGSLCLQVRLLDADPSRSVCMIRVLAVFCIIGLAGRMKFWKMLNLVKTSWLPVGWGVACQASARVGCQRFFFFHHAISSAGTCHATT